MDYSIGIQLKKIVIPFFLIASMIALSEGQAILEQELVESHLHQVGVRSQLEEHEADEIIQYLKKQGISSQKQLMEPKQAHQSSHRNWRVLVLSSDAVEAILLIDEAGLPQRKKTSIFEEYVNRIRQGHHMTEKHEAISRELEERIKTRPGVVDVEVLIKRDKSLFGDEEVVKTMLYIKHSGTLDDPHSELAESIKKEVLDNVDDLDEEHLIFIPEKEIPANYKLPEY